MKASKENEKRVLAGLESSLVALEAAAAKRGKELTLGQARVLLSISRANLEGEPPGVTELSQRTGYRLAMVSKAVRLFTAWKKYQSDPGLGWVNLVEDPYDRRNRKVTQTARGAKAIESVAKAFTQQKRQKRDESRR